MPADSVVPQPVNVDPANGEAPANGGFFSIAKGIAFRILVFYVITSMFRGRSTPNNSTSPSTPSAPYKASSNLFANGTKFDLYVYLSPNSVVPSFSKDLIWKEKGLIYGDWYGGVNGDSTYTFSTKFKPSSQLQNNGSIFLHVYVVKENVTPDPSSESIFKVHKVKQLNRFKKRKYKKTHNLLTGETSASREAQAKIEANIKEEIISHWHPNLTIHMIDDHTPWAKGSIPPPLDEFIEFEPVTGNYYPIVYLNDYWNLARDYMPINDTVEELQLDLTFAFLSMFRWQMYTAQAMRGKWTSILGSDVMQESDEEQDSIKEAFLETSPYLLALTVVVTLTHSVFEFLAFKNDIQFWKNRSSLEGLSVKSVFFNVFQSLIVLLYVLDNDTNTVVRISVGVGLLIEVWKVFKVSNVQIDRTGAIPRIRITDKGSYVESSTKHYDTLAFKYLGCILFPLLVGYAVYSLIYNEHKGVYSFILSMLYGFILTFGFIAMTPQLFINYKLKSVAHLPWRMLTYKFLNTFIDDIFAFIIKMPTLYRLGCFRDDLIFLIYLYQRWIYRVDLKRVNEFGISGEDLQSNTQHGETETLAITEGTASDHKKNE